MTRVNIAGLGAIGSPLVPLVARMPQVSAIGLIDHDSYSASNLSSQAISARDVGRLKVDVKAGEVSAIRPEMPVRTFAERLENVPLGYFNESVLLCCVDSRQGRQVANRIAHRRAIPWINAAVGTPSLIKISVYLPDSSQACLECGWGQGAYDHLPQEYPCDPGAEAPATAAPAELGAFAAALQAAELRKLCIAASGESRCETLAGRQLMLDTNTYERHLFKFRRDRRCRFDHLAWRVDTLDLEPDKNSLSDLFDIVSAATGEGIGLEGHAFVTHVDCAACGRRDSVGLSLYGRLGTARLACSCGGRKLAAGFFSFERLQRAELSRTTLDLRLARVGIRRGDVISVGSACGGSRQGDRHFQIGEGTLDD